MSSGHHATSDPTSNLHTILKEAAMQYKALTGEDLAMHPYSAQLENWNSVEAVLGVFKTQAQEFDEFRRGNNKLLTRLQPLVQTLVIVSGSLGDTLGGVNIKVSFLPYHCALKIFTVLPSRERDLHWHQHSVNGRSFPKCCSMRVRYTRLFQAASGVVTSYDILVNLFERVQLFLQRLKIYTSIQLTTELTEILGKIMAEIIMILALKTREVKQGTVSK
jgi:hypothetical protein